MKAWQKYALIAAIVLLFALGFTVATRAHIRWSGQFYFGKIVEAKADAFVIELPDGTQLDVRLDLSTKIRRGRKDSTAELQPGEQVMVAGRVDGPREIKASVVRLVGSSK
jgi:hypothetical protein